MLLSAVAFVLVFGLIVLVHEAGHFVMARRAGIKVLEFGFGYPPRIKTLFVRNGVEYTLNALPLGGFVRMLGEEGAPEPGSFSSKSARARIATLLAGPTMNLVLAAVLFAVLLVAVGQGVPTGQVLVSAVATDSPAAQSGVLAGDRILALDGQAVGSVVEVQKLTQAALGREVSLSLWRGEQTVMARLTPRVNPPQGQGAMGVTIGDDYRSVRYSVWRAIPLGVAQVGQTIVMIVTGLIAVIRGLVSAKELAGPIGVFQATGEVARLGLPLLVDFTAGLSVNIAIVNLLPIPILDGGRVALVLLEKLRGGKRMAPQQEGAVQFASLMLLLALVVLFSYFDILRLFSGQSILR